MIGFGLPSTLENLCNMSDELETLKKINNLLQERIGLTASIEQCLREIGMPPALNHAELTRQAVENEASVNEEALWNAHQDCSFANQDSRFDRVCHVFHQEWVGIRSAAGALPGHKLAISETTNWSAGRLRALVDQFANLRIRAIVVHGMSDAIRQLTIVLHELGLVDIYLVWHGNTAQWVNRGELEAINMALALNQRGLFKNVHAIRCGMNGLLGKNAFIPQLLNMPPVVRNRTSMPRLKNGVTVFCPSWNDVRKNLHSNVVAGILSDKVNRILIFAQNLELPSSTTPVDKIIVLSHITQAATIELMATVDLVSNVTVIDCHPMVNLEALAVGTPTLEGPLFLDALEGHPYKHLVRVENVLSVEDIRQAIERVLSVPEQEMHQIMDDYRVQLTETSRQRYLQFLESSL